MSISSLEIEIEIVYEYRSRNRIHAFEIYSPLKASMGIQITNGVEFCETYALHLYNVVHSNLQGNKPQTGESL